MLRSIKKSCWLSLPDIPNSFCNFRKSFIVDEDTDAVLEFSADTEIELFLDGTLIPASQLNDVPPYKSVTAVKMQLPTGPHTLFVRLHYAGTGSICYSKGTPGMAIAITGKNFTIVSDESWEYRIDPNYTSCLDQLVTMQLGYCFEYDARKSDTPWQQARINKNYHPVYRERQIPLMISVPVKEISISQCGYLKRTKYNGTFAEQFASDYRCSVSPDKALGIPPLTGCDFAPSPRRIVCEENKFLSFAPSENKNDDGCYLIIDLGKETVGFMDFAVDAPEGCIIDIAWGEHLDDGCVRAKIGARNFTDRYICRKGINRFTHRMRRCGCRYIEMHFTNVQPENVKFSYARSISQELPGLNDCGFVSSDNMLNKLYDLSVQTLKLCIHEHFEDCPWREQGLYAYDSRNQALFGYYTFGNWQFARRNFELLAENYREAGLLNLTSPGECPITIPIFSFAWISECADYKLFSGDQKEISPEISETIISEALERFDKNSGLYFPPVGEFVWNFYEWTKLLGGDCQEKLQSLYNLYLFEALNLIGGKYADTAEKLGSAIEKYFYSEERGTYLLYKNCPVIHEHVLLLMLKHDLVPQNKREKIINDLLHSDLIPVTFSVYPYLISTLMEISPECRKAVEKRVMDAGGKILLNGASSLWETPSGADDFEYAGSLCHAWSSFAVQFCKMYTLGVMPLKAGFKRFRIRPYPGSLASASGCIPTPSGEIKVSWQKHPDGIEIQVDHPKCIIPELDEFGEFPIKKGVLNGY